MSRALRGRGGRFTGSVGSGRTAPTAAEDLPGPTAGRAAGQPAPAAACAYPALGYRPLPTPDQPAGPRPVLRDPAGVDAEDAVDLVRGEIGDGPERAGWRPGNRRIGATCWTSPDGIVSAWVDETGLPTEITAQAGTARLRIRLLHGSPHTYEGMGPSAVLANGDRLYHSRGRLHRLAGPAVTRADGTREWWRHGALVAVRTSDGRTLNGERDPVSAARGLLLLLRMRGR